MSGPLLNDETSPWIRIDLNYWRPLTEGKTPVYYRKNSIVFSQEQSAETIYIVKSGRIRVTSYQSNGMEKQIYIAEQGAMFGESSCIQQQPHNATAVAIVDSYVYGITYPEMERVMKNNWELTQSVMHMICRKNNILFKQVLELSFSQSLQRIAQILLNIGKQYGSVSGSVVHISIKFTHQDVASMINTSRVTVSNIFTMLSEKGIISKENGYFILNDVKVLENIADGSPIE